ncbi:ribonuclease H-like domain-containing protein [Tanacetum coccineum]
MAKNQTHHFVVLAEKPHKRTHPCGGSCCQMHPCWVLLKIHRTLGGAWHEDDDEPIGGVILDSKGAIPSKTVADAKIAIQEMAEYSRNGTMIYSMAGSDDENPPPPPPPPQTPTQQAPHTVSTIKLPILKKGEYDIWAMKMEHYLSHTDYPIWEVIQKGNGPVSVSTDTNGVIKVLPPKTAEEILARERERKARTTLLMALPEDHLAKFHKMTDAKEMWDAIKSRFGGNDESKKMQKYILKQQFEGFSVSNSEGLHKGYDRFQSLLSQLEIHGAGVSTEDANQKFLRSLPSSWSQVSLVMRTKPGVDSLSFDDLYNNLRVFESDVKGSTGSSSSAQNVAFVSSESTSSTNDVSTAYGVSTSSGYNSQRENSSSYTDELMYSFFANQSSGPQLDHEDLEQLDEFDLEEMDLKWQVAMISMRLKKFYKKTGRRLQFDAKEPVGFDKTKVECFNCHKTGHFARECRSKGNQESRRRDAGNTGYKAKDNRRRPGKQEEPKALVTLDGEGVDWTGHAEDEQENFALMAYSNFRLNTRFMKIDLDDKTDVLTYHKKLLAEAVKEKEELKTKLENFQSSSKGLSKLLNSQMSTRDKSGLGYGNQIHEGVLSYEKEVLESVFDSRLSDVEDSPVHDRFANVEGMHAVPPPMTGNYMPPGPDREVDDSMFTYGPKQSKTKQEKPSFAFVNTVKHVKTPRETVKEQNTYSPSLKADKRYWNGLMSKKLGLGYGFTKKACFVCGNFSHLIRDCDFHEKRMAKQVELNKRKGKGTGQGENRPVWNNVQRLNHQNKFVPKAVLTKTDIFPVNTARQNLSSQAATTSTARKVNTARPIVNEIRPRNNFYKSHSLLEGRSNKKVNTVEVKVVSAVGGKRFSMKDMGEANVILGIRIKHESNGIAISQSHYIEKVLKKFNYSDCTLVSTPLDTYEKLMPNRGLAVSQLEYSTVIGCLMYAMTCTRPDIAFAVGKLSRYTSNPGTQHWKTIQRVLKYLKKTMDYRLIYFGYPSVLEGYTDASWISNTEDNSSTSGWVFLLGGGAISWASKKQTCVTGSTMKSEFVALAAAGKEAEWLKTLLLEIPLWVKPMTPISIRCDSTATLAKAYSQMYNGKSKHLGVRHSVIRELITNGVVSIEFVRSQQNLADHLTKGLARDLVIKSTEGLYSKADKKFYNHKASSTIRLLLPFQIEPRRYLKLLKMKVVLLLCRRAAAIQDSEMFRFWLLCLFRKRAIGQNRFTVKQKEYGIFISQDKYVVEILKKFDFASVKTASTLIETQKPLTKDEEAANVDVHLYRSMIGSLMYLTASRPDIILQFWCLFLGFRVQHFDLEAYSDSDYGGANLDRKSTTRLSISWQETYFMAVQEADNCGYFYYRGK